MHTVSPVSNTAFFSLTWPAAMQIYYFLEQKKVFTQDWFRPFLHLQVLTGGAGGEYDSCSDFYRIF